MPRPLRPLSLRYTSVVSLSGLLFTPDSCRYYLICAFKKTRKTSWYFSFVDIGKVSYSSWVSEFNLKKYLIAGVLSESDDMVPLLFILRLLDNVSVMSLMRRAANLSSGLSNSYVTSKASSSVLPS